MAFDTVATSHVIKSIRVEGEDSLFDQRCYVILDLYSDGSVRWVKHEEMPSGAGYVTAPVL